MQCFSRIRHHGLYDHILPGPIDYAQKRLQARTALGNIHLLRDHFFRFFDPPPVVIIEVPSPPSRDQKAGIFVVRGYKVKND